MFDTHALNVTLTPLFNLNISQQNPNLQFFNCLIPQGHKIKWSQMENTDLKVNDLHFGLLCVCVRVRVHVCV